MIESSTPGGYRKAREWVAEHGGDVFPTLGSFEWFVRNHRAELVAAGVLIVRRGACGSLVGPGFGEKAIEIMRRESQARAGAA